ncbi:hypothetical protein D3C85_788210 [compost metagenome]
MLTVGGGGNAIGGAGLEVQVAQQGHAAKGRACIARRQRGAGAHCHGVECADACQRRAGGGLDRAAQLAVDLQGTGGQLRGAGVGAAVARQGQPARAELGHRARAGQGAAIDGIVRAVEDEAAVVDDIAGQRARGAAIADLQQTRFDRGGAGVGILARQHQGAGARVAQFARAADVTAEEHAVAALDCQRGAARDIDVAGNAARGCAIAHLQRTGLDRRAPKIGIASGQHQGTRAQFGQAAVACECLRHGVGVAGIGDIEAAARRAQADGSGRGMVGRAGYPQRAALEVQSGRGVAEVGVGGHRQGSRAQARGLRVGIGAVEHQGAQPGLVDAVAGQRIVDRGRPGRGCRAAVADTHFAQRPGRGAGQGERVAGQAVAVADELHALRNFAPVHRHRAGGAAKDREGVRGLAGRGHAAGGVRPVRCGRRPDAGPAAHLGGAGEFVGVPEIELRAHRADQVDLLGTAVYLNAQARGRRKEAAVGRG